MPKRWTGTSPVSSQRHEIGCSYMTQRPCIKQQNGLRGTTIRTSLSSVRQLLAHLSQEAVIHLEDASSHGVVDRRTRSLSSQLPNASHGSSDKASRLRVGHSRTGKTRTYGNSLDNATFAEDQGIRHRSVKLGRSKAAEVISLEESPRNRITRWDKAHIIRETSERATREE